MTVRCSSARLWTAFASALCSAALLGAQAAPQHTFFRVQASSSLSAPVSGRLLIFVRAGSGDKQVSISEFHQPNEPDTWVCAQEVHDLAAGQSVEVDADQTAYPKPMSQLPAGTYEAQAVLDTDHSYNYDGRDGDDWISPVVNLGAWKSGSSNEPTLVLDHHAEENPRRAAAFNKAKAAATPDTARLEEFQSPLLTRFWGRATFIRAWVILPPDYAQHKGTFPTAYWTHGFGGDLDGALMAGMQIEQRMKAGQMPPMFWVMLDESVPQGTHEFADSVNNGPWGEALTTEFIPALEKKYKMDARRDGRFLNGHSSGGWATLQLEVNYPKVFGGTWSTSPDPSDFHDFTGIDLYAPHANVYHRADGTPYPLVRDHGKVVATFEEFARMEAVLGPYGGQISSFDWVFSPKGKSGAPEPMFDRVTGDVHPDVVGYWREHYDLAHIVQTDWAQRGKDLKGRIHVFVGTADTFYLDGAAHKFEAVLKQLNADPHFTYIPDRTHFDLYVVGKDRMGLFDQISTEMWAVARPKHPWHPAPAPAAPGK